jgi:glycosyltransferase involved in cell wall biosynthesis
MERLTCTVIIPTFNRAAYIAEAIESILGQTRKPDQVIVVNDGSTDDTLAVLEAFAGRIEVISKPNGGKSTAINMAMPQVRGDCVWIFDDDDVALPDALERHLGAMEADPDAGFTYSSILVGYTGEDGRIAVRQKNPLPGVERDEFFIRLMEHCFIQGQPAVVARTDCLRRIGPFDERLIRCQDYDIFLRLGRYYLPARIEDPTFIQRRHSGPRGTVAQIFDSADPFVAWSQYNRIFIAGLLNDLSLSDYVRKSDVFSERTARIQRLVIAARHGLLDHAEGDLGWILERGADLTAQERAILFRALVHFTALREVGVESCLRLARLCKGRVGRQVRVTMAKGLIYEMLDAARLKRLSEIGRLMPRTLVLIGVSGAVELLREKLPGTMRQPEEPLLR